MPSRKSQFKRITLKKGREESLRRMHPWVFSGGIASKDEVPEPGEIVEVFSAGGEYLATAHYNSSSIALKILSFQRRDIDEEFFRERFAAALELRRSIGLPTAVTTGFRMVNAEGDLLPGLIVDIYEQTAVLQFHSLGMSRARDLIVPALQDILGNRIRAIYNKSKETLEGVGEQAASGFLMGSEADDTFFESGLRFAVDIERGQKTGFYLDQRANRLALRGIAKDKTVLNAFCYTGGFTISALAGGASQVHSVDSSASALNLVEQNIELNDFQGRHESIEGDCLQVLRDIDRRYDVIVLDPPAFAKRRAVLEEGLRGYRTINTLALKQIQSGGLLLTFSCSQLVTRELFRTTLFTAAAASGRSVKVISELHQAGCHPVSIYHPEGDYLKGLLLHVQ